MQICVCFVLREYWGLDIAPIMIAFFLLYVPPFFVHRSRKKASSIGTLSSLGKALRLSVLNGGCVIGGVYKYCHDCFFPPLCTSLCTPQSEKSFQHSTSTHPLQRLWRSVLNGVCISTVIGGVDKYCHKRVGFAHVPLFFGKLRSWCHL